MRDGGRGEGTHRSIRWIDDQLQGAAGRAIAASLPSDPIWLWGEVLTIQRRERVQYLTLLDSKSDRAALDVSLPSELDVQIGEMICVEGRLEQRVEVGSVLRLQLKGDRIVETKGPSQRVSSRRRLLNDLRRRAPPLSVQRPVRSVVLVSSSNSKSVRDFEGALQRNLRDAKAPTIQLMHVALDRANDVARGIREAGARSDVELIVVLRGGGHALDLLPFCSEEVTRAVAEVATERPLMLAVGHAEDIVVAGEFAALDLDTPTAAGQCVAGLCRPRQGGEHRPVRTAAGSPVTAASVDAGRARRRRNMLGLRLTWPLLLLLVVAITFALWLSSRTPVAATATAVPAPVHPSTTAPAALPLKPHF